HYFKIAKSYPLKHIDEANTSSANLFAIFAFSNMQINIKIFALNYYKEIIRALVAKIFCTITKSARIRNRKDFYLSDSLF
ncbi:hypothetical protein, partial [Chryseobacterium koreense]